MNLNTRYIALIGIIAVAFGALSVSCGTVVTGEPDPREGGAEKTLINSAGETKAEDTEPHVEPDVVHQDPSSIPAPDNAILAAETGLSVAQIDRGMASQEEFTRYVDELIRRFPDEISRVWMDSPLGATGPSTKGHVQFTAEVPAGLKPMDNVRLTGGGMISMADHRRRAEMATQALIDLGYAEFATSFVPAENVIRIELLLLEGASAPSKSDLVAAIQERIETGQEFQSRATQVLEGDVALTVLRGPGPFITTQ